MINVQIESRQSGALYRLAAGKQMADLAEEVVANALADSAIQSRDVGKSMLRRCGGTLSRGIETAGTSIQDGARGREFDVTRPVAHDRWHAQTCVHGQHTAAELQNKARAGRCGFPRCENHGVGTTGHRRLPWCLEQLEELAHSRHFVRLGCDSYHR